MIVGSASNTSGSRSRGSEREEWRIDDGVAAGFEIDPEDRPREAVLGKGDRPEEGVLDFPRLPKRSSLSRICIEYQANGRAESNRSGSIIGDR